MLEKDLEKTVTDWAEELGGGAVKLVDESGRGWPDRTIFLPNCRIVIAELKRPKKNKCYEAQRRRVAWLQHLGFAADFVESIEELRELHDRVYP